MQPLDFVSRLWLAFLLPWRVLFDGRYAAQVDAVDDSPKPLPEPEAPSEPEPEVVEAEEGPDFTAALQLLAILQREGRFVDFLNEDVASFSDAEVGAAARVVHEGCARALKEYVTFESVRGEEEGADVKLEPGYDATQTRVTGNVAGEPPYEGKLAHHGWRVTKIELPTLSAGREAAIIAPAEVEL